MTPEEIAALVAQTVAAAMKANGAPQQVAQQQPQAPQQLTQEQLYELVQRWDPNEEFHNELFGEGVTPDRRVKALQTMNRSSINEAVRTALYLQNQAFERKMAEIQPLLNASQTMFRERTENRFIEKNPALKPYMELARQQLQAHQDWDTNDEEKFFNQWAQRSAAAVQVANPSFALNSTPSKGTPSQGQSPVPSGLSSTPATLASSGHGGTQDPGPPPSHRASPPVGSIFS